MTSATLPKGFRSVKASQVPGDEGKAAATSVAAGKPEGKEPCDEHQREHQREANGVSGEEAASPSSMSEISIETANGGSKSLLNQRTGNVNPYSPPSSSQLKYWTLPRNISSGRQRQDHDDEDGVRRGDSHKADPQQPPATSSAFLYETPANKYFTLPNPASSSAHPAPSSSSSSPHHSNHRPRPSSAYSVPAGGTRAQVAEGHGSDWYKSMFNRLHKYEGRRRGEEEPVRIKYKTRRPKGESSTNGLHSKGKSD